MSLDGIRWHAFARVIKYDADTIAEITKELGHEPSGPDLRMLEARYGLKPDGEAYADGNLLTTAGLDRITKLIIGGAGNAFSNTNSYVGVGDGNASVPTPTTSDVNLTATTNKYFQQADGSNPTQSNGVITCNCTYTGSNANFAWNEWCFGIANTGPVTAGSTIPTGVMLNHKGQSLGTKGSGSTWTLQATITLS